MFGKAIFGGLMGHFRGQNGHFRRLLHLKMPQTCLKNAKNGWKCHQTPGKGWEIAFQFWSFLVVFSNFWWFFQRHFHVEGHYGVKKWRNSIFFFSHFFSNPHLSNEPSHSLQLPITMEHWSFHYIDTVQHMKGLFYSDFLSFWVTFAS